MCVCARACLSVRVSLCAVYICRSSVLVFVKMGVCISTPPCSSPFIFLPSSSTFPSSPLSSSTILYHLLLSPHPLSPPPLSSTIFYFPIFSSPLPYTAFHYFPLISSPLLFRPRFVNISISTSVFHTFLSIYIMYMVLVFMDRTMFLRCVSPLKSTINVGLLSGGP